MEVMVVGGWCWTLVSEVTATGKASTLWYVYKDLESPLKVWWYFRLRSRK